MPKVRRGAKSENFTHAETNALAQALEDALVDETQAKFADRVGVSQQTVSRLIGRKGGLTRPSADAIARGLPGGYTDAAHFFREEGLESVANLPKPATHYDAFPNLRLAVSIARSKLRISLGTLEREIDRVGGPNPHFSVVHWMAIFTAAADIEERVRAEVAAPKSKRNRATGTE